MPSFTDPRVVCRPALPSDKADVLRFTRRIWEGRDYIHLVWDDWLADPRGLLISAQFGPRVVGIAKVTPVFPGQWWLHGLRVDPDYQGLKIGSRLHEYSNAWWIKNGGGTIRLLTSTKRVQVHHLCERTGYARVGEVITYRRPADAVAAADPAAPAPGAFTAVKPGELASALTFVRQHLPHLGGLMDTGWRFVLPDQAALADRLDQRHLHWWRGDDGLLATWEGDDDDGPVLGIGFAAVSQSHMLAPLLRDAAGLAPGFDLPRMFWFAPTDAAVQSALQEAGYVTDEDSGVIYERQHPDQ